MDILYFSYFQLPNLQDYPLVYDDNHRHLISNILTKPKTNKIIEQKTIYESVTDPNYYIINNFPLLIFLILMFQIMQALTLMDIMLLLISVQIRMLILHQSVKSMLTPYISYPVLS